MKKPLTTTTTRRPLMDVEPGAPRRGPTSADLGAGLTPPAYCLRHALPDEWAAFREQVAGRVASEPAELWWRCDKCGLAMPRPYRAKPGGPCVKCNFVGYADGGQMKQMTAAEVRAYRAEKAAQDRATAERWARAALYAENERRQRQGLKPFTAAEFKKAQAPARAAR